MRVSQFKEQSSRIVYFKPFPKHTQPSSALHKQHFLKVGVALNSTPLEKARDEHKTKGSVGVMEGRRVSNSGSKGVCHTVKFQEKVVKLQLLDLLGGPAGKEVELDFVVDIYSFGKVEESSRHSSLLSLDVDLHASSPI